MFEALGRLRFQSFLNCLCEERQTEIEIFVDKMHDAFPSNFFKAMASGPEMKRIDQDLNSFIETKSSECSTFKFWSSFLQMMQQLLDLTRATLNNDGLLHLKTTRAMLPWYLAYDHHSYGRHLPVYWCEMTDLATSHPNTHKEFTQGRWAVQR